MAHSTTNDRDKAAKQTPENARIHEEAAARGTKVIKRRVLKKQARKARAEHLVKVQFGTRKEKTSKKAAVGAVCQRELHGRQRRLAKSAAEPL